MHDADFDRRACRQIYQWTLNHIFDTKIAAQLAGFRQFGLGSLLQELLGIQVNKKFQTCDWLKRPIPKDALDYAARDTGVPARAEGPPGPPSPGAGPDVLGPRGICAPGNLRSPGTAHARALP